ncbi:MAG: ABC transporter permease [Eubacteriales bacterium]
MEKTNEVKFARNSFGKRLKSMLKVDFRRMFTMPLLYIMLGICLVMPVLILVMTTLMDGTVTVDPETGVETVIEGFDNVWQTIGSVSGEGAGMSMDLTGMCNINMLYFLSAVLVCVFVADDFRSGYAKNLFTVRARKTDYVVSKTLVCFVGGAGMLLAYFVGAMLGGAISGLPFDTGTAGVSGIVMCLISKVFLMAVFVAIFLLWSVAAKQRLWLSIIGSLCSSMLLFTMIPMITPLDSSFMNVILCLVGGGLFGLGLGAVSNVILKKTSLV